MDINLFRGILAVMCLLAFLGIVAWAWSGRQRERFAEAANLPFAEPDDIPCTQKRKYQEQGHHG